MAKGLVIYYTRSENTLIMAQRIAGAMNAAGVETRHLPVDQVSVEDISASDAVVIGSPVYYGGMTYEIKKLIDETIRRHARLDGKVGGAFASAVNIGGGGETTIFSILNALLIHGFIIQGDTQGSHYGPISVAKPDEKVLQQCARYGERIARLTLKLHG